MDFIFKTKIVLDRWYVYGLYNLTGKLNAAQHAIEPMPIIHGIILANQPGSVCLRRGPFQIRCDEPTCWECRLQFLDLVHVWSVYVAPLLARHLISLLPLKKSRMHIVNIQFGNFSPDDIDWERLERANGNKFD